MTAYAVNIADLLELSRRDPILTMTIAPHVAYTDIVEAEHGKAVGIGHAALMNCPEEQAAAIVQVARKKYRKYELRFYTSITGQGSWKRL